MIVCGISWETATSRRLRKGICQCHRLMMVYESRSFIARTGLNEDDVQADSMLIEPSEKQPRVAGLPDDVLIFL